MLVVTVVTSVVLSLVGLPSAVLFGALMGGMAHALTSTTALGVPALAFRVGQGLIGVTIGTMVSVSALSRMGRDVVPILVVTAGTVVVSLIAGRLLALRRDVSPVTGAFAMIAGGASGIVAVARELGADDRVVTVVQYLRVMIVLVTLPLVTAAVFHPGSGLGRLQVGEAPLRNDLAYVALALVLGLVAARYTSIPTATLLGPLLVAAAIAATGWLGSVSVPTALQWLAYTLIGVQVGLRFTRASLASIAKMLPAPSSRSSWGCSSAAH